VKVKLIAERFLVLENYREIQLFSSKMFLGPGHHLVLIRPYWYTFAVEIRITDLLLHFFIRTIL